jgi:hypothetical protein
VTNHQQGGLARHLLLVLAGKIDLRFVTHQGGEDAEGHQPAISR